MTEQWKDIPGYEGFYRVSDLGRVESVERVVPHGAGTRTVRQRFLRPGLNNYGYEQVNLCEDGTCSTQKVHRLVLLAFIGPCPEGMEVCHSDGDPRNNHLANLRYGTSSENTLDAVRHGTHRNTAKTECKRGHQLDEANTYMESGVRRKCRECRQKHNAAYRARKLARLAASNQPTTEGKP